jgi:hypothetical protein
MGGKMLKTKMIMVLLAVALGTFGLYGAGYGDSFHNGGVGYCEGCHTMHNSAGGTAVATGTGLAQYQSGPYLLQGPDVSSTCLNCHEGTPGSYHISTTGVTATSGTYPGNYDKAGGDFSWLRMGTDTTAAQNRGHNIVSLTYNYASDTVRTVAPGGTYDSTVLGCSGCHNPHGTTRRLSDGTYTNGGAPIISSGSHGEVPGAGEAVGAYRLFGGSNYVPQAFPSVTFAYNPPYAAAVDYSEGDRVAYGTGMSEWCANCHDGIYENAFQSGTVGHRHPASSTSNAALTSAIVTNYNTYLGSGITGGAPATAKYNRLVPTEEGNSDVATLETHAASTGNTAVSTSNNVMCLSCHRAHASGFANMGRFSFTNELVTDETGGWEAVDGISDTTYIANAYNGNIFGVAQRTLCNKCHAQD